MINQVLNIEQMQHLQKLGVDTSKASMEWMYVQSKKDPTTKTEASLFIGVGDGVMMENHEFETVFTPTFTLQDIIELLPKRLDTKDKKEGELLMFYDSYMKTGWNVRYTDYFDIVQDFKLIDALYKLLCWCAEKGYLKGGEK